MVARFHYRVKSINVQQVNGFSTFFLPVPQLLAHWGVGTRAERKTTEKEAQIVVLYLFCDVCRWQNKTGSWQGSSR